MADTQVTFQSIIDNSIARAKDSAKTQWSDDQMLVFGKKALSFVHKILIRENSELAVSSGSITLVADTQEYDLSGNLDNFWRIAPGGVYFDDTLPLTPISVEDAKREGSTTTDSDPKSFYLTADKLGLVNIPTATAVSSYPTLKCRYFAMETVLALDTVMPYKNLFNESISAFMDHIAVLKTTARTAEYTAIYNALEESTLEILRERAGL